MRPRDLGRWRVESIARVAQVGQAMPAQPSDAVAAHIVSAA
jgi:hypothetical protein